MKIKSIKSNGVKPTWDIEVDEVHEYVMGNGIVSHNTANILGNEACFEPITSNIYNKRLLSGEFIQINKYLIEDLCELNLWDDKMRNDLIAHNGSVQNLNIPQNLKDKYKTVWEIKNKHILDMASSRGAFIDQTQSMNVFMENPTVAKLNKMHFYGWGNGVTKDISIDRVKKETNKRLEYLNKLYNKFMVDDIVPSEIKIEDTIYKLNDIVSEIDELKAKLDKIETWDKYGSTPQKALKTGMYYLRSKAASDAVKFTVNVEKDGKTVEYDTNDSIACSLDDDDCLACGA